MTKKAPSMENTLIAEAPSDSPIVLTPSHFFQYATHPQWIWFDRFGNPEKKEDISEFTLKLMENGVLLGNLPLLALRGYFSITLLLGVTFMVKKTVDASEEVSSQHGAEQQKGVSQLQSDDQATKWKRMRENYAQLKRSMIRLNMKMRL